MIPPPIPADDAARVSLLRSLGVLDTPPEPDYDELTHLAAQICDVPIALISLVDSDRQWFKSKLGLPADTTETRREVSFCAHAIAEPTELFVVADAHLDPRFADNPSVLDDPNVRFYAGAPLVTQDGWALGTLCVIDRRPRELTPDQLAALRTLRRHVVNALELRRLVARQNTVIADLDATRRSLEEARRAAESAARAKADFLATMSHEIRTPMNAVIGFTDLLRGSPLNPEQRENVDLIHESGEHLLTLINDILDFSKIESGRLELESAPFDLPACIRSAVAMLLSRAAGKNLDLRADLAPDLPVLLRGDATRIRQILVNLLSNAVKFTERGAVTVRASAAPAPGDRLEITVAVHDTGIGIPADRLGRVFERYAQADTSTTRRFGGTGLGLAISRRLAELHGGTLRATSELGRGSVFSFSFVAAPLAVDPAAAAPLPPPPAFRLLAQQLPFRLLVAEDNPVNQKVIGRTLEKLGYTPVIVADGAAALAALHAGDFDLVLMDIEMPVLDGTAATRRLRAELPPARQPVVVAVTAHAVGEQRGDFLACGLDDYLAKPIRAAELSALLSRVPALLAARRAAHA